MFRSTSRFPHFDSQLLTASIKGGKGVSEKKLQQQHRRTLPAIMATFDEQQSFVLNRSSRATRGKRMTKLLDDELEDDEQFWNQDALKEEEDDTNYEEEKEAVDVFDSDFDEDEPEPDEEVENDADVRVRTKKRLMFPGKTAPKRKTKRKVLSKLESASKDEEETSHKQQTSPSEQVDDLEGERIMRKSTRTSVIVRQAERDAIRAALQATMKPIVKRKKEGEEKRMTQEEMLLEAAQTEIMNLKNLERVLAREEEVKKRAVLHKAVYSGPQIRYSSRNGQSFLEFSKGVSFESEICTTTSPYPQQAVCAVTGLPAKYRDPKTGLAYATKDSFRIIRERFLEENSKERKKMEMGILFDAVSSLGFLPKRKRSQNLNRDVTSYQRYWARFRSIPALEYPSLD